MVRVCKEIRNRLNCSKSDQINLELAIFVRIDSIFDFNVLKSMSTDSICSYRGGTVYPDRISNIYFKKNFQRKK